MSDHQESQHNPQDGSNVPARGVDRREFLRIVGFTMGGLAIAGCQQADVERAIPFLIKPEEITPGHATWYATTCTGCNAGCGILAKNRDGRPIKLEGNRRHPISRGGLCAVGQASLLPLYDSQRLMHPLINGRPSDWPSVDQAIIKELESIKKGRGSVRILTGTISSPTTHQVIRRFLAGFKDARHVVYDPLSSSAILDAHERTHGTRLLPRYRFENAEVILSFGADFLGTWISPVEFTAGYRTGRSLEASPSRFSHHIQVESVLSLTGSNADERLQLAPEEMMPLMMQLTLHLARKAGTAELERPSNIRASLGKKIQRISERLWKSRGSSLVVCGVNNIQLQILTNYVNHILGNYGTTIDIESPSFQRQGNDRDLQELAAELRSGRVDAMFVCGVNPLYDLPDSAALAERLDTVRLVVSFSEREDETAAHARFVCPTPHMLELWNDGEHVAGVVSLQQPLVLPFGNTRPFIESLSTWSGRPQTAYDLIRDEWKQAIFKRGKGNATFEAFWDKTLEDGYALVETPKAKKHTFRQSSLSNLGHHSLLSKKNDGTLALLLYSKIAILDGRHAHNPWLQELPDPVTKIVWDNHISISPAAAAQRNISEGDVLEVQAAGGDGKNRVIELPAHIQLGQHDDVAAVALGYGRKGTDRFTKIGPQWLEAKPTVPERELVGKNAAPFLEFVDGFLSHEALRVNVRRTGEKRMLASTQEHDNLNVPPALAAPHEEPRPIIQQTTLAAFRKDPASGSFRRTEQESMWPEEHQYPIHHWGMAIDLTACTGCSACVTSCQAENNIPVVGKDEVHRSRELTWIRIDRYYEDEGDGVHVSHQPMLCHHCSNAPCETVCPVLATVHSEEGLNQQIYNRCVGTRYCSNNCPYKVRRFNWFEYAHGDERERLVLNPDVTVRERGVMEKCSFCVQRIQEAKIEAARKGFDVKDGDIRTACEQSCPAQAIVFGDMNDPNSELSRRMKNPRYYRVLEELGIRPSVGYLTLVRDTSTEQGENING